MCLPLAPFSRRLQSVLRAALPAFLSLLGVAAPGALLDQFKHNEQWTMVASAQAVPGEMALETTRGEDNTIAWNGEPWQEGGYIFTHERYGDAIVKLEFMIPQGSNAGVYLQGAYEIQIFDSYGKDTVEHSDLGGLYQQWDEERGEGNEGHNGVPPMVNAAKAPGEWQTLEIHFRAPRFDPAHNLEEPAMFLKVLVNDQLVHRNQVTYGPTRAAPIAWRDRTGPVVIQGDHGPIAIRSFEVQRADFGALSLPDEDGATNRDALIDLVELGHQTWDTHNCTVCHATAANDPAFKTGPNLYGVFTHPASERQIVDGENGNRFVVNADLGFLRRSLRQPHAELAIIAEGDRAGEAYQPLMPPYLESLISEREVEALYHYLATRAPAGEQGPVVVLAEEEPAPPYDPMTDPMQILVGESTRIHRGSMDGLSGRAIHVGLPGGINYSFDPRTLAVERVWLGGFLDASGEWQGRGGGGFAPGHEAKEIPLGAGGSLLAPLDASGEPIDFTFKEAKFRDFDTIDELLHGEKDHLAYLAAVDAAFLGYRLDPEAADRAPSFLYRVGANRLEVQLDLSADGEARVRLKGDLSTDQAFALNRDFLKEAEATVGEISAEGVWTLPAGTTEAVLTSRSPATGARWTPDPSEFHFAAQPLETVASEAQLPAGYTIEDLVAPKDRHGRDQLFESLGMDVTADGTVVIATRTAGVWRLLEGEWRPFAEGLFDSLGVIAENAEGTQLVVSQKPELTRLTDTDGDGRADLYETLSDSFSYHSNYHSYTHGPVRDAEGRYYYTLNLAHADEAIYKAGGEYMGTRGGFRGWAIRVSPENSFERFAHGLRSPAGLSVAPDGAIWYSESQGEFVGTSKLFKLEEDGFYGHPVSLVDLPGMTPDSPEIQWERVADERAREIILFPHNRVANSPGHPSWDTTDGAFGPFAGQMFIGDQTQSALFRVVTEVVDEAEQGVILPFARGLHSGVMRLSFLPDGSMLAGQTGRGWQSQGGHLTSLQRIRWDGETVEPTIRTVQATPDGFTIHLTHPVSESATPEILQEGLRVQSWTYRDSPAYGSPELLLGDEIITGIRVNEARDVLTLSLAPTDKELPPEHTGMVYLLELATEGLFDSEAPRAAETLQAYYTLHRFPAAE